MGEPVPGTAPASGAAVGAPADRVEIASIAKKSFPRGRPDRIGMAGVLPEQKRFLTHLQSHPGKSWGDDAPVKIKVLSRVALAAERGRNPCHWIHHHREIKWPANREAIAAVTLLQWDN